jgi:hypothetical protein
MYVLLRIKLFQATFLNNLTPILVDNHFLQKFPAPFLIKRRKECLLEAQTKTHPSRKISENKWDGEHRAGR